jgi:hypothetical protein
MMEWCQVSENPPVRKMPDKVEGWLFAVPSTHSISFFPAFPQCVTAELLPWQSLLIDAGMLTRFANDMKLTTVTIDPLAFCYYIHQSEATLETWFAKNFKPRLLIA